MQLTYIPGMRDESEGLLPTQYTMQSYGTGVDMAVVETTEDPIDLEKSLGDFNVLPLEMLVLILEQTKHPEKMALRLTSRAFQHLIDEIPLPLAPQERKKHGVKSYFDYISKTGSAFKKNKCLNRVAKVGCCLGITTGLGCLASSLAAVIAGCFTKSATAAIISKVACKSAGAFGGTYVCLTCSGLCGIICCGDKESEITQNAKNCKELRSAMNKD